MKNANTDTRKPVMTAEEARIKKEEAYCWRIHDKELKEKEARIAAEMEAGFRMLENGVLPEADEPEIAEKDSRKAGSERRHKAEVCKGRTSKKAADAAANREARRKTDRKRFTSAASTEERKSRVLRADKLGKRADKIASKK